MTFALAIAWMSVAHAQASVALQVGSEYYLPGPAVRLGRFVTSDKFSRDGQFITFIDERPEASYPAERALISQGTETSDRRVVRFDLKKGTRQTLFSQSPGETLISTEPVGPGGDVICTVSVGVPQGDEIRWRAVYCPVDGAPKVVAAEQSVRSFQVASSETERKAIILSCGLSGPTRFLYLTPDTTIEKTIDVTAYQGGFFQRTRLGNPIASLQGDAPNYSLIGNFEFDFATGEAKPIKSFAQSVGALEAKPLISFEEVERSKGDPLLGQVPLRDVFAFPGDGKYGRKRLLVAQGVITSVSLGPKGLAFTYLTTEGLFLKEMVKADSTYRKKLNGS